MAEGVQIPLDATWTAFVHRAAALTGAAAGLIALLAGETAAGASLRGASTWGVALVTGHSIRWLLRRLGGSVPLTVPSEESQESENDSTLKPSETPGR